MKGITMRTPLMVWLGLRSSIQSSPQLAADAEAISSASQKEI